MRARDAVIPVATLGALLAIDADYVTTLSASGIFAHATWIELLVFGAGLGKTVAMLAVGRLRRGSLAIALDIYGAELLLLPFMALAYLFFGLGYIPSVMSQLLLGWVVGVSVGGLAFMSFRIGRSMLLSEGLARAIPSAIVNSEVGLLFISSAAVAGAKGGTLDTVIRSALSGYGAISLGDPIFYDFAAIYVLLLLYATMRSGAAGALFEPRYVLAAVLATCVTGAWAVAAHQLSTGPESFVLVPPALAIVAVSWVLGRGS